MHMLVASLTHSPKVLGTRHVCDNDRGLLDPEVLLGDPWHVLRWPEAITALVQAYCMDPWKRQNAQHGGCQQHIGGCRLLETPKLPLFVLGPNQPNQLEELAVSSPLSPEFRSRMAAVWFEFPFPYVA